MASERASLLLKRLGFEDSDSDSEDTSQSATTAAVIAAHRLAALSSDSDSGSVGNGDADLPPSPVLSDTVPAPSGPYGGVLQRLAGKRAAAAVPAAGSGGDVRGGLAGSYRYVGGSLSLSSGSRQKQHQRILAPGRPHPPSLRFFVDTSGGQVQRRQQGQQGDDSVGGAADGLKSGALVRLCSRAGGGGAEGSLLTPHDHPSSFVSESIVTRALCAPCCRSGGGGRGDDTGAALSLHRPLWSSAEQACSSSLSSPQPLLPSPSTVNVNRSDNRASTSTGGSSGSGGIVGSGGSGGVDPNRSTARLLCLLDRKHPMSRRALKYKAELAFLLTQHHSAFTLPGDGSASAAAANRIALQARQHGPQAPAMSVEQAMARAELLLGEWSAKEGGGTVAAGAEEEEEEEEGEPVDAEALATRRHLFALRRRFLSGGSGDGNDNDDNDDDDDDDDDDDEAGVADVALATMHAQPLNVASHDISGAASFCSNDEPCGVPARRAADFILQDSIQLRGLAGDTLKPGLLDSELGRPGPGYIVRQACLPAERGLIDAIHNAAFEQVILPMLQLSRRGQHETLKEELKAEEAVPGCDTGAAVPAGAATTTKSLPPLESWFDPEGDCLVAATEGAGIHSDAICGFVFVVTSHQPAVEQWPPPPPLRQLPRWMLDTSLDGEAGSSDGSGSLESSSFDMVVTAGQLQKDVQQGTPEKKSSAAELHGASGAEGGTKTPNASRGHLAAAHFDVVVDLAVPPSPDAFLAPSSTDLCAAGSSPFPGPYIDDLYVAPSMLRKGVGTMLMGRAEQAIVDAGGTRAYLGVLSCNEDALAFYRALGWSLSNSLDGTECSVSGVGVVPNASSIPALFTGDDGMLYCRMTKRLR